MSQIKSPQYQREMGIKYLCHWFTSCAFFFFLFPCLSTYTPRRVSSSRFRSYSRRTHFRSKKVIINTIATTGYTSTGRPSLSIYPKWSNLRATSNGFRASRSIRIALAQPFSFRFHQQRFYIQWWLELLSFRVGYWSVQKIFVVKRLEAV